MNKKKRWINWKESRNSFIKAGIHLYRSTLIKGLKLKRQRMVKADSGEYDERTEYLESDGNIRSMYGLLCVAVGKAKFVTVE